VSQLPPSYSQTLTLDDCSNHQNYTAWGKPSSHSVEVLHYIHYSNLTFPFPQQTAIHFTCQPARYTHKPTTASKSHHFPFPIHKHIPPLLTKTPKRPLSSPSPSPSPFPVNHTYPIPLRLSLIILSVQFFLFSGDSISRMCFRTSASEMPCAKKWWSQSISRAVRRVPISFWKGG
jgi:hypothetical protein